MIKVLCKTASGLYGNIANRCFSLLNLEGSAQVELLFVTKQEIKQINKINRNIDKETDVLSFPLIEISNKGAIPPFTAENYPYEFDSVTECVNIGSVLICEEKAKEQAVEFNHSLKREKGYLFLHGLLHILGYDHNKEQDKLIMRKTEEQILNELQLFH